MVGPVGERSVRNALPFLHPRNARCTRLSALIFEPILCRIIDGARGWIRWFPALSMDGLCVIQ